MIAEIVGHNRRDHRTVREEDVRCGAVRESRRDRNPIGQLAHARVLGGAVPG